MKRILTVALMLMSVSAFAKAPAKTDQKNKNNKPKDVELVFILDRSGSMGGLESDTIGGYNSMLSKQKKEKTGKVSVTTVLFDDQYELLYNQVPIEKVSPMTEEEYYVRGSTALLDAIGKTVMQVKANQDKKEIKDKVLFVIITDGMENASREYRVEQVKKLIEERKEKDNWEFLFLGANIDAIGAAQNIGIDSSRAVRFKSDKKGTAKNYEVLNEAIKEIRGGYQLNDSWKNGIEEDVKNRGE
ncbi:MAG: VWA domain-containing protein [Leptotrichia sp.]|jgi:von willebrand factor type A domain-containing protein|nr:VWA domain-containing protein [Leptotrichia sp.]